MSVLFFVKIMNFLQFFDFIGVAVFAATGALAASRKQLDIVGFIFLAAITGIGGGTLRDLLLGRVPVFWVKEPNYLLVCVAVAVAVFFLAHLIEYRYRLLLWLDAIGIAAYCVLGTMIGLESDVSPLASIVMGVMTATFGGIFRDLLSGEKSVLLRDEIYISASLLGAVTYVILITSQIEKLNAVIIAISCAFLLRAAALHFGWTMPCYKSKQGRKNNRMGK